MDRKHCIDVYVLLRNSTCLKEIQADIRGFYPRDEAALAEITVTVDTRKPRILNIYC